MPNKTVAIIPYKGNKSSKSRLRESWNNTKVDILLPILAEKVIQELNLSEYVSTIYLLTRNHNITLKGTYSILEDKEHDLNSALNKAVNSVSGENILIVMADLPFINSTIIDDIVKQLDKLEVVLAPSQDNGTSILAFNRKTPLEFVLGKDSSKKFKEQFTRKRLNFKILEHKKSFKDIDILDDVEFLPQSIKNKLEGNN